MMIVQFDTTPEMEKEINRILEITSLGSVEEVFRKAFTLLRIHVTASIQGDKIILEDGKATSYEISLPFEVRGN